MPGNKTHEQQLRTFEHKEGPNVPPERPAGRDSAPPASREGLHQEDRDHNKHNASGQAGHKPQQHSPAEEKH
ncbi:MAG TPA: hypothetical protein VGD16_12985 [Enterovirga sp.]|jgi:hypothetical protein